MTNGFKDKDGKFHPISQTAGVRKSRDQKAKRKGVKIRKKTEPFKVQQTKGATEKELVQMQRADVGRRALDMGMSEKEMMEWEKITGSEIVKVKHEMLNGRPITSVRFANGEEWFEFDDVNHQEEFIALNEIEIDHERSGEFIEIDHPMIAGYVTMSTGKIAFGEREDKRMSRDGSTDTLPTMGKAIVKFHTSNRGDRGTQFTLEVGKQLSDIGVYDLSPNGIDRVETLVANASKAQTVNSKDDMFKFSREIKGIIDEMIEDGDLK